jgi:hypothetical protein
MPSKNYANKKVTNHNMYSHKWLLHKTFGVHIVCCNCWTMLWATTSVVKFSYNTGNVHINVTLRHVHVMSQWKSDKYNIFWVCVDLGTQHAMPMHPTVLWPVAFQLCSLSTLSHKQHNFQKKLLNIKHVLQSSLHLLSATFLIQRKTEQVMIKNVYWSSCKVCVILVRF